MYYFCSTGDRYNPRARTPDTARQNFRANTWPTCIRTQGERTYVVIGISRRVIFKERLFEKLFRFVHYEVRELFVEMKDSLEEFVYHKYIFNFTVFQFNS